MFAKIVSNFVNFSRIDSRELALDEIKVRLNNGESLVRWGDGEVSLIEGDDIPYQDASEQLSCALSYIFSGSAHPNLIICSPLLFINKSVIELIRLKKFKIWFRARYFHIQRYLVSDVKVGDAFCFRIESNFIYKDIIKDVCENKSRILLISSNPEDVNNLDTYFQLGFSDKAKHILVSEKNSFDEFFFLKEYILKNVSKDDIVLSSAGPVSKLLAFECSRVGVQCIDLGHFFSHQDMN